jgi:hypothetical protein
MPPGGDRNKITVDAVVKYCRTLLERAARAKAADPYADPYNPTEGHARNLCTQLGPAKAREELSRRAVAHELKRRESEARATRAASELAAHQLAAAREREAQLAQLSIGQRLDVALIGLGLLSETSAAPLDGDRVTGPKAGHVVLAGRRSLEHERLCEDVLGLVRRVERTLEQSRRRMIEEEAA